MELVTASILLLFVLRFWSYIGNEAIAGAVYFCYTSFVPSKHAQEVQSFRRTQKNALETKHELANTSAQDEFAKWAKLRRKHDKLVEELERLGSGFVGCLANDLGASVNSKRTGFEQSARSLLWIMRGLLRYGFQFYHRKTPVLYLPRHSFPSWILALLSLPSAPYGSVSIGVWLFAVDRVLSELLAITKHWGSQPKEGRPMAGNSPQNRMANDW